MDTSLIFGFGFILLGAICNGTFALFHKFVKEFEWENTWGCFFFFTMLVIPAAFAAILLEGAFACWSEMWSDPGPRALLIPMAFGFLWGCGSLSFGIGVSMIGLSLGYAIIMGLASFLGSLIPLLRSGVGDTTAGAVIIGGDSRVRGRSRGGWLRRYPSGALPGQRRLDSRRSAKADGEGHFRVRSRRNVQFRI